DGFLDLYVGLLDTADPNPGNFLYRNNHDGTFVNVAADAGVNDRRDSNGGVGWADYNNDGFPDLYVANRNQPNRLYRNSGNGTFTDVASELGLANQEDGRVGAWADIDNDGFLDLFVSNFGKQRLFRNTGDGNHWLALRVAGVRANRDGIGTRIEATAVINGREVHQIREVSAGGSRHSQDNLPVQFGLGDAQDVDLVVTIPGGTRQHW